jgi:hypothetical protein
MLFRLHACELDHLGQLLGFLGSALADPRIKAQLADAGGTPLPGTPADLGKLVDAVYLNGRIYTLCLEGACCSLR